MAVEIAYSRADDDSSLANGIPEVEEGEHLLLSVNETKSLQSRNKDVNLAKDTTPDEEMNLAVPPQNNPVNRAASVSVFRTSVGKSNYVERKPLACRHTPKENPLAQVKKTLSEMEAQLEGCLPVCTSSRSPVTTSNIGSIVKESTDYLDHSAALEPSYNFRTQTAVSSLPTLSTWKFLNDQPSSRSNSLAAKSKRRPHSNLSAGYHGVQDPIRSKSMSDSIYSCPVATPVYSFHLPKSSAIRVTKYQNTTNPKASDDATEKSEINDKALSTYQSDYWACVLPAHAPPFQDRRSPRWDPHKEYEDLLDYTYPLKPKYLHSKKVVKKDFICDTLVHDSGIDLDSFSVSPDSTVRSTAASFIDPCTVSRNYSCLEARNSSLDSHFLQRASSPFDIGHAYRKSSTFEFPDAVEELSRICEAKPSTCFVSSVPEFYSHSYANSRIKRKTASISTLKDRGLVSEYIPTTWLLPLHKEWEIDEDYLALPCSVQGLNALANQLQTLSAEDKLLCNCKKSLDLDNSLDSGSEDSSSTLQLEVHKEQKSESDESKNGNQDLSDSDTDYSFHSDQENCGTDITKGQGDGSIFGSINKVSSLMDRLTGTTVALHTSNDGDQGKDESLVQLIQKFCCKLDELIQWLYQVSETTENWVSPQPDAESIKSSLDRYMAFRRDIAEHQTLADTAVSIGKHLMTCTTSLSPGLKHALRLIEKQAEALDRHAEGFYTSILSAMDNMKEDVSSKCEAQNLETAQTVYVV